MNKRDIGQEILDGIKEIKNFKSGQTQLKIQEIKDPSPAKVIRKKLSLTQLSFASLMGISVRTLQDWEQGRRTPQGPAKALLRIAENYPEVFTKMD